MAVSLVIPLVLLSLPGILLSCQSHFLNQQWSKPVSDAPGTSHLGLAKQQNRLGEKQQHRHRSSARSLLATYPSLDYVVNGTVNATMPGKAFATWCDSDSSCRAQDALNYTLAVYQNTSALIALLPGWPSAYLNDSQVTNVRVVSAVADLQLSWATKTNQTICSSSQPCEASLQFTLSGYSALEPFLCMRLEPGPSSTLIAVGWPSGTSGLRQSGFLLQASLTCATTTFGKHMVVQYSRVVAPPPPSPPASPPPPPIGVSTGKPTVAGGSVYVTARVPFSLDFDSIKSNASLLEDFKADTCRYLAQSLAVDLPALMMDPATLLPFYDRVAVVGLYRGSLSASFRIQCPVDTAQAQADSLTAVLTSQTASLFAGSRYASYVSGPATISSVEGLGESRMRTVTVIAIIVGLVGGGLLVAAAVVFFVRRNAQDAVLPKDPQQQAEERSKRKQAKASKHGPATGSGAGDQAAAAKKGSPVASSGAPADAVASFPGSLPFAQALQQQQQPVAVPNQMMVMQPQPAWMQAPQSSGWMPMQPGMPQLQMWPGQQQQPVQPAGWPAVQQQQQAFPATSAAPGQQQLQPWAGAVDPAPAAGDAYGHRHKHRHHHKHKGEG